MPPIAAENARYVLNITTALPCTRSSCNPPTGPGSNCWCNTPASAAIEVTIGNENIGVMAYTNEIPSGWEGTTGYRYQRALTLTTAKKLPCARDVQIRVVSTNYIGSPPLHINGTITERAWTGP